jgi:hypothetical protein
MTPKPAAFEAGFEFGGGRLMGQGRLVF